MTASRLDNEAIFHAARDIPDPDRRRAYVREACGGGEARIAHLEALLAAAEAPDSLLDRPAGSDLRATIDQPTPESPGTVLGPYQLLEPLGEGGMGTVWLAQQAAPVKRLVAVKLIKAGMDSKQVLARFEAERQALALMDHPNIAKVLDAGTTGAGRPYVVMDLVKGVPITRYCDEHRLTPRQRLELFVPVCQALQHAHQKGIIHRDVKPSNVLVAPYDGKPVPRVIDFGVAKAVGQPLTEQTLVTGFGAIVGTPEYMSPEQAQINQLDVDTRSDVYSLGVLLYELLTGSPPFTRKELENGGLLEMLRVIREQEPTKPSAKLSTAEGLPTLAANRGTEPAKLTKLVRGELDWIVMKALDKDRNGRYETANGLARDVERYLHDEPVAVGPPSRWYRLRKFVRRNKGPVLAASLVALALVVGILGTTWGMLRAIQAEGEAVSEANHKQTALTAAQRSERKARDNLRESLYEQASARRFSRLPGQRLESLEALAKAAAIRPDERLRDAAIAAMALPDVRPGPSWHALPSGYDMLAFDAQYRLYARASEKGVISIRSLPDDQEIRTIVSAPIKMATLWFSPDGRYLARVEGGGTLKVWRVADGEAVLRGELRQTYGWDFSPDSRQVVVGQQGWILRFDLATGQELNRWQLPESRQAHQLAFHPDNRRVAVGYCDANFTSVYDATSGELVAHLPVGANSRQVVVWHPDGVRLAVGGSDARIQIWNVPAKRKVATLEGHVQDVMALTIHPDGDLLASTSWDGTTRLWDPATGRQLLQFFQNSPGWLNFSSDGRYLGYALHGEQARLLELTASREYRTLVSILGADQGADNLEGDVSPDGRLLALCRDGAVRLWHLPSGRELAVLPGGRPHFQSNGELLIAGPGGLQRWPIQPGAAANELRLGPPRTIPLPAVPHRAERSPDGRTLAIVSEAGGTGLLVDLATDTVRPPRFDHAHAGHVALSRDGRWLATSGWHSDRVRLWRAVTGKMVHEWRLPTNAAQVFFTPDSRVLIISRGDEFSFHDVKTLEQIRKIRRDVAQYPGSVAFSPDGKLMALEMAPGIVHLKDAATDRTVARLEDPHGDRAGWMGFTPDGTQLVVAATYARCVHVWDLRAIRQRLKGMGLDWAWAEFQPAARADGPGRRSAGPAWKAQVNELDPKLANAWNNRGVAYGKLGQHHKAVADFSQAIDLDPKLAMAWSNRGLAYLSLGQPAKAIADCSQAIELDPKLANAWSNRGLAYLSLGQYDKAIANYSTAIELDPKLANAWGGRGFAYLSLGQYDKAVADYETALKLAPAYPRALNALAWLRATCPDAKLRDPDQAVKLAGKAVLLAPKVGACWQTLGVAHYRAGDWETAVAALEKSLELFKGGAGSAQLFLAMAHRQLGNPGVARKAYAQAVQWLEKHKAALDKDRVYAEELRRFRTEAEEVLELKKK
jgi:eukaryotic-like serine/threonine-protein kinase